MGKLAYYNSHFKPRYCDVDDLSAKIDDAEHLVSHLIAQGKDLLKEKESRIMQLDNLANGLHINDLPKLSDYGISPKKYTNIAKPKPDKGVIKSIKDNTDGMGFILEREVVTNATTYEWQKASGDDPTVTNIDEGKMVHFKITTKKVFADDDVKKGVRYFCRFRGTNSSSNGAWSEPVSRVQ